MKSEDPERRQAAYSTLQLLDESALPKFQTALYAAKTHHEKRLSQVLGAGRDNLFQELAPQLTQLAEERERVMKLIRTDYKKDSSKVKMLRNEVEDIDRLRERASRLAAKDLSGLESRVAEVAAAIVELGDELERVESHREGEVFEPDDSPAEERQEEALAETYDGEQFLAFRKARQEFLSAAERLEKVYRANEEMAWASASQKQFAHILNTERAILGLRPLQLEERLSAASSGHSQDMKDHGFFAHQSPVEGKKTPGDRARLAKYQGGWSGENIFMGSSSPQSAYNAWFASDGHRFIMFAGASDSGPNELGVGPVGSHWTMMTGRK
ncbi:CAP domain-containing protein [Roseibacillus ishigakijimensis]|uniref:SCP domain-containing protein n=2 Tax=Roseibacillus ishigakijimensis TaxID=454146 RepID=A0A934RS80_9BACT|nr:hypothetical protein [Roseibacillus ishigakijimensis]